MPVKNKKRDTCGELSEHPEAVARARAGMLPAGRAQRAAELFKVLGDTTRVKMLHLLAKGELCVCDLAALIEMSQSAVSHQLRVLRGARLVKYRKDGKNAWYSINDSHVARLLHQGVEHVGHD